VSRNGRWKVEANI